MKFLCPSCKAKYQIADEKVAGRSVRMKCRKCGYVIPLSEVPPAPDSILPGEGPPPVEVPKAPLAPVLRPPPAVGSRPAVPGTPASKSPLPGAAGSKSPLPGAAGSKSPSPPGVEAKSSPAASRPLPPVEPKPGVPARPTVSDVKAPPKPAGSRPGAAPRPSAAQAGSSPQAAPAPRSSPLAAPKPAPAPAAAPAAKPAAPAVAPKPAAVEASHDLLPAIDEDEGDGVTRIAPGGALADAFGALVSASGAYQAPPTGGVLPVSSDEWFVGINDVPVGPIRLNELRKRALVGAVTLDSLVWRDGLEAWRPLRTFPELTAVLEEGMSSVRASLAPLPAPARPATPESDPFGSGVSPGGVTGPVVVSEDIGVAGLPRSRMPIAAWFAIAIALAFGVVIGFVIVSDRRPPETIVKYVEVRPDGGAEPGAQAVVENVPAEVPGAASAKTTKPRTTGTKSKTTDTPGKEGGGLTGLKGLDGLSPSGPGGPTGSNPGTSTPSGGGQLDGAQIQATVAKYTGSVKRSCWQPALDSRDPSAPTSARVMVSITVGPSGSVQNVTTSGEPRGYPGLASCIAGRVRSWQFPATGGTTTANVPFVFAAQ
jgi:predicted Zn finger-like uncharacterized protein